MDSCMMKSNLHLLSPLFTNKSGQQSCRRRYKVKARTETTMASHEEEKEDTAAADGEVSFKKTYPEVYCDEELNPAQVNSTDFQVDHSAFTSPKELEKQAEEGKKENKGGAKNLKSTLLISGVVVGVIGVMFAIVKKIKES